jgi:leucyl-tRNA synthetase
MPQWAGSCWYFLRFIDPKNDKAFVDPVKERQWMPVDLYIGGAEHAVLHLLYSRFWHKVLFDRGYVSTCEPFQRLVNQGMILGEMEYQISAAGHATWSDRLAERGFVVQTVAGDDGPEYILKSRGESGELANLNEEQVEKRKGKTYLKSTDLELLGKAEKMSKARGNVVNPDQVVREFGADSLRLYEMFMGPLEASKPWSMKNVNGVRGFLDRVWRLIVEEKAESVTLNAAVQDVPATDEQNRVLHKTIKAVTADLETLGFNTAIARMMEFVNFFTRQSVRPKSVLERFVLLLSPLAPHISEELWSLLGNQTTLAYVPWPKFNEALTQDSLLELPVQVNGKLRGKIVVSSDSTNETVLAAAKADEKVIPWLAGKKIAKEVVVPGRLVNFVVQDD